MGDDASLGDDVCPKCDRKVAQVVKTGPGNYRTDPCGHSVDPIQARELSESCLVTDGGQVRDSDGVEQSPAEIEALVDAAVLHLRTDESDLERARDALLEATGAALRAGHDDLAAYARRELRTAMKEAAR